MKKNFTDDELNLLVLVAQGLNNQQISNLLKINLHTIKNKIHTIAQKLKTADRYQTAKKAIKEGLIPYDNW